MIEPFLRVSSVSVENSLPFLAARAAERKGFGGVWEERRRMRRAKSWPRPLQNERGVERVDWCEERCRFTPQVVVVVAGRLERLWCERGGSHVVGERGRRGWLVGWETRL